MSALRLLLVFEVVAELSSCWPLAPAVILLYLCQHLLAQLARIDAIVLEYFRLVRPHLMIRLHCLNLPPGRAHVTDLRIV